MNKQMAPSVVHFLLKSLQANNGKVDFDTFYRRVWKMPTFAKPCQPASAAGTEQQQARLVFDTIDDDRSQFIELTELAKLLVQWGCPDDEVVTYLYSMVILSPQQTVIMI